MICLKEARQKLFEAKKTYEGIPEFNEPEEEIAETEEERWPEEVTAEEAGETESAQNEEIARLAEILLVYPAGSAGSAEL